MKAKSCKEEEYEVNMSQALTISETNSDTNRQETQSGSTLQELERVILDGWLTEKAHTRRSIKTYWHNADELLHIKEILYKENHVIIVHSMRSEIVIIIHSVHLGIEKCKQTAQDVLF